MAMEEALVARLVAAGPVTALAGNRVSWFGFQRGDPLPGIALTLITPGEEWTHGGPDGLDRPRVRFDCRASTGDAAMALSRTVKTEMRSAADVGGWRFHPAMLEADRTIDQGEQEGGEPIFQLQLEFMFYHEEI